MTERIDRLVRTWIAAEQEQVVEEAASGEQDLRYGNARACAH